MADLSLLWPVLAQNFKAGKSDLLERYLDDDQVSFEQKVDGTRVLILLQGGGKEPVIVNRNGGPLKHSASLVALPPVMQALSAWPVTGITVLDAEFMWSEGELLVFDMPYAEWPLAPKVTFEVPYARRRERADQACGILDSSVIRPVAAAYGYDAKQSLVDKIREINGEGVMVKRLDAPYSPGQRVSHSLKVKFTKTCDVIVIGLTRGVNEETGAATGNITFGVLHAPVPGFDAVVGWAMQGSCSAIGRPDVEPGTVIEVEYLAYTEGGGLREPRMTRVREDKQIGDCTMEQFREHSRAVL